MRGSFLGQFLTDATKLVHSALVPFVNRHSLIIESLTISTPMAFNYNISLTFGELEYLPRLTKIDVFSVDKPSTSRFSLSASLPQGAICEPPHSSDPVWSPVQTDDSAASTICPIHASDVQSISAEPQAAGAE